MALTNVLIALFLDPPFSGQPLRLDGVPASRITHAPIRRRHDPDASADVLPPPVFARQGLERPHHPRHLVEGEGQEPLHPRKVRHAFGATSTSPLTTSPLTTGPLTTGPLTTGPLTTGPQTTHPVTTRPKQLILHYNKRQLLPRDSSSPDVSYPQEKL